MNAEKPRAEQIDSTAPAVEFAWQRCRELRHAAQRLEKRDRRLQTGFIAIIYLVIALAVLSGVGGPLSGPEGRSIAEIVLITLLIVGSTLLTFAIRAGNRDAGRLLRSGVAEVESAIFCFGTLLLSFAIAMANGCFNIEF